MMQKVNKDITSFLFKGKLPIEDPDEVKQAQKPQKTDMSNLRTGRADVMGNMKKEEQKKGKLTQYATATLKMRA